MTAPTFDLATLLRQLATRNPGRSEADIQADVRNVLLYGGFDLEDEQVALEQSVADQHRLDVAVGGLIIECKRKLTPSVAASGAKQLAEYLVADRRRRNGILTDGLHWKLYRFVGDVPQPIDEVTLSPGALDERAFRWWLGALLSTERGIKPTGLTIERRLGASSSSFLVQRDALRRLWLRGAEDPTVQLKRSLWAKLLQSAFGSPFKDTDDLFVEHTYLVLLANAIAHAVIGFDLRSGGMLPGSLLSGQRFEEAGIGGVAEAGFFDWPLSVEGGNDLLTSIIRSAAVFDWNAVDHDVLKALYQSVIAPEVRHSMGEYYTPDWLAQRVVGEVVDDPLRQRVLDPSCGSGTFLFHAVRHYLAAADAAGVAQGDSIAGATNHVFGVDLHPVAVSLAQVTYLLAIGTDRLPRRTGRVTIPVYIGDSMRWDSEADSVLSATGDVAVKTTDGHTLFASELRFPAAAVANPRFDELVNQMTVRATQRVRGSARPSVDGLLRNLGVSDGDLPTLRQTFHTFCDLHDENRNHIWGFYVRNQARPAWLSLPENRVHRLVGNPPWLAYRHMPSGMKAKYRTFAEARGLWSGGAKGRTTQQDLAGLFVARSVEQFLVADGHFGFVLPRAALSRQTYGGFRRGDWSDERTVTMVDFDEPWDLLDVDPEPFRVPGAVVFGRRLTDAETTRLHEPGAGPRRLPSTSLALVGKLAHLELQSRRVEQLEGDEPRSPYAERFRQGAILVPRMLAIVVDRDAGPLGVQAGSRAVRSRKTSLDKRPWKDLPALDGVVETTFLRPALLGESIGPFRVFGAVQSIVPWDGECLLSTADPRIDRYPGLADWMRQAEGVWVSHRRSDSRTFLEQLNYIGQLSAQFPIPQHRVVYTASGNTIAAARVSDQRAIVEHKLYWGSVPTADEARYICGILNAPTYTSLVAPYQSLGSFGTRDFDKYVWQPPVPTYDPTNEIHRALSAACELAEVAAAEVALPGGGFQADRKVIRSALKASGTLAILDELVAHLVV